MQRLRGPVPLLVAAVVGGLVLSTAACSTPPKIEVVVRTTPAATAGAASAGGAMLAECGIVSVAHSIAWNAAVDRGAGRLTPDEYAAVLNTVAPTLLWRPKGLSKPVRQDADRLDAVVGPVTAGHDGPAFDPRGEAFRSAFEALAKDCDAAGTPTGTLATSGG